MAALSDLSRDPPDPAPPRRLWSSGSLAQLTHALPAGLISGLLAVILSLSLGAAVFVGPLEPWLARGFGMALVSCALLNIVLTLRSSIPTAVGITQETVVAVLAVVAATIARELSAAGAPDRIWSTVLAAALLAALMFGATLFILGRFRWGRLIRFIPYPVLGGFLAGTGLLLTRSALGVMTGIPLDAATVGRFLRADTAPHWLAGVAVGTTLVFLVQRIRHVLILPSVLALSAVVFYGWLGVSHTSQAQATADGWLFGAMPSGGLWQAPTPGDWALVAWPLVWSQVGNLAAVVIVSTLALLLNASGIELATRRDVDLDTELRAAGLGNLLLGLLGGMPAYQALSLSILSPRLGVRSRLIGVIVVAVVAGMLLAGASLLSLAPRFMLGSVLWFLGLDLLVEWVYKGWFKLGRIDYGLVLVILLVIAFTEFLAGVVVGIVIAVLLFVFNYSQINVVKHTLSGTTFQSNVDRSPRQRQILQAHGDEVYALALQGYLFFGTAHSLLDQVRHRLADTGQPTARFVLVDFRRVIGMDSSAGLSFAKLRQLAQAHAVTLVFSHLTPALHRQLAMAGYPPAGDAGFRQFATLDYGMEWCEDELLREAQAPLGEPLSLAEQLRVVLPPSIATTTLVRYLEPLAVEAGVTVMRQGEPADALYIVEAGQVTVLLDLANGERLRLRTMGPGTLIGELGFYLGLPRTASVVADEACVLRRLTQANLARMHADDPAAAAAFHAYVSRILAERVVNANRTVETLLR